MLQGSRATQCAQVHMQAYCTTKAPSYNAERAAVCLFESAPKLVERNRPHRQLNLTSHSRHGSALQVFSRTIQILAMVVFPALVLRRLVAPQPIAWSLRCCHEALETASNRAMNPNHTAASTSTVGGFVTDGSFCSLCRIRFVNMTVQTSAASIFTKRCKGGSAIIVFCLSQLKS